MTAANLSGYVAEKRAQGIPWDHIANMAGCCADDLRPFHDMDFVVTSEPPQSAVAPAPALSPLFDEPAPTSTPRRRRRGPGGLLLAVLYAVGDGYSTSLRIAHLLETSIDNVNNALGRMEACTHVERVSSAYVSPVVWVATDEGMQHLRTQLSEGVD